MGVVILAGPSGSGKSHLAARLGWTVLRLDDFYRDADEPDMPRSSLGIVDWDDVGSWNAAAAVDAIRALCDRGTAEVPVYDIAASARTGSHTLTLTGRASSPKDCSRRRSSTPVATRACSTLRSACVATAW